MNSVYFRDKLRVVENVPLSERECRCCSIGGKIFSLGQGIDQEPCNVARDIGQRASRPGVLP